MRCYGVVWRWRHSWQLHFIELGAACGQAYMCRRTMRRSHAGTAQLVCISSKLRLCHFNRCTRCRSATGRRPSRCRPDPLFDQPQPYRTMHPPQVIYDVQKREKAAAKQLLAQRRAADPKEVRFSCQIGEHDLGVKMAQVRVRVFGFMRGGLCSPAWICLVLACMFNPARMPGGGVQSTAKHLRCFANGSLPFRCPQAAPLALLLLHPSRALNRSLLLTPTRSTSSCGSRWTCAISQSMYGCLITAGPQVSGGGQPAAPGGAVQGRPAGGCFGGRHGCRML